MKSKVDKIKADPRLKSIADDLDKVSAVDAVADTDGGKILIKSLATDVLGLVDELRNKYRTLTIQEFVSIGADLKSKIDLIKVLKNASKNKDYLKDLLEEELLTPEED